MWGLLFALASSVKYEVTANDVTAKEVRNKEEYIAKELLIKDPTFYDVFTDDEIYSLFAPVETNRIPIYVWRHPVFDKYNANCGGLFTDPLAFSAGDTLWRNYFTGHEWVVTNKEDALLFFVPTYETNTDLGACKIYNPKELYSVYKEIYDSPEYQASQGTNFFGFNAFYIELTRLTQYSIDWWKPRALIHNDWRMEISRFTLTLTHPGSVTHLLTQPCSVLSSYLPLPALRDLHHWPLGCLESYQYPGGMWEHMKKNRPYNLAFFGQADYREAYEVRRLAITNLTGFMEPSLLVRYERYTDDCEKDDLPLCQLIGPVWNVDVNNSKLTGCCLKTPPEQFYREFNKLGKFGLHFRGDDWSSSRLSDIIAAQMIPVIVMKESFTTQLWNSCNVPWDRVAVIVDHNEFMENPRKAMQPIIDLTNNDREMEKRLRIIYYYRAKLLHRDVQSAVKEDLIRQIVHDCVPESLLRQQFNYTKTNHRCPFGDPAIVAAFPSYTDDGDHQLPWGPHPLISTGNVIPLTNGHTHNATGHTHNATN